MGHKTCGTLRSTAGKHGLALLRVRDVLGQKILVAKGKEGQEMGDCKAHTPKWWDPHLPYMVPDDVKPQVIIQGLTPPKRKLKTDF